MEREAISRRQRFDITVQKSRGVVYTTAVGLGVAGKLLGVVAISWLWIGVFLVVADLSAVAFYGLARLGVPRVLGLPVRALWMAADVAIVSWAVYLSGGMASFWFVFYLTNVAAATYVGGVRGMVAVMVANTVAYVGVAGLRDHLTWVLVAHAIGRKMLLYGAAFFALLGIPRLERRRRQIKELQAQAQARADELARLMGQLEAANRALAELSTRDPLTSLPNRRFLVEHARGDVSLVRRGLDAARRRGEPQDLNLSLGFLMVDLDHFKAVNDGHGHETGDRVLVATGLTLQRVMRETDSVVRWGGEEFLVVARKVNRAFMGEIAQRIRLGVAAQRVESRAGQELAVTCSVGYCCFPLGSPELFSWEEVVTLADAALVLAKRAGRNRCVGFEAGERPLQLGDRERVLRDPAWAVRAGFLALLGEVAPGVLETATWSSGWHPAATA